MPLPETIEKTYLPDDQVDATTINAMQHGIVANHARIEALSAPHVQWLVGRTLGDVIFAPDGSATIDGSATVFLDIRQAAIVEIRVHCRADASGIAIAAMDGADQLADITHTGDGSSWTWVALSLSLLSGPTDGLRLNVTGSQQQLDQVSVVYRT